MKNKGQNGFTLIELLISFDIIALVSIMAFVILPQMKFDQDSFWLVIFLSAALPILLVLLRIERGKTWISKPNLEKLRENRNCKSLIAALGCKDSPLQQKAKEYLIELGYPAGESIINNYGNNLTMNLPLANETLAEICKKDRKTIDKVIDIIIRTNSYKWRQWLEDILMMVGEPAVYSVIRRAEQYNTSTSTGISHVSNTLLRMGKIAQGPISAMINDVSKGKDELLRILARITGLEKETIRWDSFLSDLRRNMEGLPTKSFEEISSLWQGHDLLGKFMSIDEAYNKVVSFISKAKESVNFQELRVEQNMEWPGLRAIFFYYKDGQEYFDGCIVGKTFNQYVIMRAVR